MGEAIGWVAWAVILGAAVYGLTRRSWDKGVERRPEVIDFTGRRIRL